MRISLQSRPRRILVVLVSAAVICLYVAVTLRAYVASRLGATPKRSALEWAVRLEPDNAEYPNRLGRFLSYAAQDFPAGVRAYRRAVALNPYAARYWLDLAGAYLVEGKSADEEGALEQAARADPTTPSVAWEVANHYLVQGRMEKALPLFRVALANDPNLRRPGLELCWRATQSAETVLDRALVPRPDLYLAFLNFLLAKKEYAAADGVWSRLIALNKPFDSKAVFGYLEELLERREVGQLQRAWQQLGKVNPGFRPYVTSGNLIVNGGFDQPLLNAGLDWRYHPVPNVKVEIDGVEFRGGSRSLMISFDGGSPAEAGILQFVPVQPAQRYEFSAYIKAEDLETTSGPRFAVNDAYTGASYLLTEELPRYSNVWRLQRAEFQTGAETRLLLLKLVRVPSDSLIKGRLWIDDVSLVAK